MMKIRDFSRPPGKPFHLAEIDPGKTGKIKKEEAQERLAENQKRLTSLQNRFFAARSHSLLIVLQAMDGGGKDGTIRSVMGAFNPQGVEVTSFKVPTPEELSHDFLWRVHNRIPGRGTIGIFNRSHYEDVLVVRVKELVPEPVWRPRYEAISQFEKLLADNSTRIVKIFLHISPEEQAERMKDRMTDPDEYWKFNPGDLEERRRWPDYMAAYEEALSRCNTSWAPWYVVPADHKWYRNLLVSEILVATLEGMHLEYPKPPPDAKTYRVPKVKWP
ncbi:MAG TPA: polyphosphate kinase 2 family protein [Thermoanaerobaculia bacterium]|nr:polyphosphate kinase 2 family protein [Thermoanaerobaculia bacterium]